MSTDTTSRVTQKTEHDPWVSAGVLFEYAYSVLHELPDEERWEMIGKLRQHAFGVTDDIAQAVGSSDPRDAMHYAGSAVRHLHGLKNVLTMAKRAGYVRLDPDKMLLIDRLIDQSNELIETAKAGIPTYLHIFEQKIDITGTTS